MTRAPLGVAVALVLVLLTACAPRPLVLPAPQQIPPPDPAGVERVIFLVGDAGEARREYYPILTRLEQDIEWWAERLPGDSAVSVLFLGDIVYPLGLHPPGSEQFPEDSAVVMDQVRLVAGPFARSRQAQGYFIAGNHDWGLETEWEGFIRLKNLDSFLNLARQATGASVRLAPDAGTGGPYVLDLGRHLRILMLDTAWWILDRGRETGAAHIRFLEEIEAAMESADGRHVLIAAHHPFESIGSHGGGFKFWRTFGVRYLLARSGAILQDLSSVPYQELEDGLYAIFARTGAPLVFAGGHDHSLQVFEAVLPNDPLYSLVSGSASKLTAVGAEVGLLFARSAPGYMRLVVGRDGEVSLYVEAAPERFRSCPGEDPERGACMQEGVASFRTIHSQHLHSRRP